MEEKQVRRMPFIDRKNRMTGMLILGDLAHATRREIPGEFAQAVSAHHWAARGPGLYATLVEWALPGAAANIPLRCLEGTSVARNARRRRKLGIGRKVEKKRPRAKLIKARLVKANRHRRNA